MTIQPQVLRSLKTKCAPPTYTCDDPIARIPSMKFQMPAMKSRIEANTTQPTPAGSA